MFFQALIYIGIAVLAGWIAWTFIIKPILEAHGVKVDDEKEIQTDHTKRLDKVKKLHDEAEASADAVEEELDLSKDIKGFKKDIKKTEKKIKKL